MKIVHIKLILLGILIAEDIVIFKKLLLLKKKLAAIENRTSRKCISYKNSDSNA